MSFWSGIKYALNSTIGTKDFESLDKMLKSNYTLIANDTIMLKNFMPGDGTIYILKDTPFKRDFTPNYNGNLKASISVYGNSMYVVPIYFEILREGVTIASAKIEHSEAGTLKTNSLVFEVEKNKIHTLVVRTNNSDNKVKLATAKIYGTTIGGRVFSENEVV